MSTSGNDANSGTADAPFRTIQAAADAATPGTTVHVAPGTYAEAIHSRTDGTAAAPIVYVSDVPGGAVIKPSGETSVLWWDDGAYVTIKGFDIDGSASPSVRNGIYLSGAHSSAVSNEVHHINQVGVDDSQGGGGIILGGGYYGHTDQNAIGNSVHDIGGATFFQGIYHQDTGSVVNNVVYNVAGMGISLWHDVHDVTIANNTVYDNGYGIGFGAGDWYGTSTPANNIRVVDNIAYANEIGIGDMGSVGTQNVVDHNMAVGNGTNYNLQSGMAHTNDITGDPHFMNYSADNVHLAAGSPAINTGIAAGVTVDMDGVARGVAPDLGAYEWHI
ncbi:choice-of-anchor Q domain-containing protein [Methylobacterium nigriterrae]|uniref:choice-of-anchor Q domain-containing protein n=1 Tax=Methylobacterium nigriterrae TaxID=3127512 RepID=UPI003013E05D